MGFIPLVDLLGSIALGMKSMDVRWSFLEGRHGAFHLGRHESIA